MAANEPMREPEMRPQKESNCWQMANQLALALPLCARYTIPAAADAAAVTSASIVFVKSAKIQLESLASAFLIDHAPTT